MTDHTYGGHTAEPWAVWTSNSYIRISTTGRHARDGAVVDVATNSRGRPVLLIRPEDARRIVACVNALAGWETETLERYATDGAPGRPNLGQAFRELRIRAERAEMWQHVETSRADELLESARRDGEAIDRMTTNMTALVTKLAQLKVYVDTLQTDAERYRWLRDRCGIVEYAAAFGGMNAMLPSGGRLDAAIDAARAQPAE